jgi:hypothetical protein
VEIREVHTYILGYIVSYTLALGSRRRGLLYVLVLGSTHQCWFVDAGGGSVSWVGVGRLVVSGIVDSAIGRLSIVVVGALGRLSIVVMSPRWPFVVVGTRGRSLIVVMSPRGHSSIVVAGGRSHSPILVVGPRRWW